MRTLTELGIGFALSLSLACGSEVVPNDKEARVVTAESHEEPPRQNVCKNTRNGTRDLFYSTHKIDPSSIFSFKNDLLSKDSEYNASETPKRTLFEHCLMEKGVGQPVDKSIRSYESGGVEDHIEVVREFLIKILGEEILDTENMSAEESASYVDMILSRSPDELLIFPALYTMFPNLDPLRRKYILGKFLEILSTSSSSYISIHELMPNAMELAQDSEEKEWIARYLIEHGSDLDIEYIRTRYPEHYENITEGKPPERSGYLQVFSPKVLLSNVERSEEFTNIIVHPFYLVFEISSFKGIESAKTLEDEILNCGKKDSVAPTEVYIELYQEYEHMKALINNGERILLVLPRFTKNDDEEDTTSKMTYAKLLKDILGEYENYSIVESALAVSGNLVDYDQEDIERILGGQTAIFSGGYAGLCLKAAKDDFRALGVGVVHNVPASTLGPGYVPMANEDNSKMNCEALTMFFTGSEDGVRHIDKLVCGKILEASLEGNERLLGCDEQARVFEE